MVEKESPNNKQSSHAEKTIDDSSHLSEQQLKMVLEGSELGFWDWNIETNEVQCNDRWAQMLGYSSIKEFEDSVDTWTNLIYPDDRDIVWKSINDHFEGRTTSHKVEYRILTKDGAYKWILDNAKVVQRDSNGQPLHMCGTHMDISDRKNIEQELIDAKLNLDELLEESITVVYRCEPSGGYPATFISQNIKRQLMYEPEQFIENPNFWASHIHPDDSEHVFAGLGNLFENGYHSHEYRFLNGNGDYIWMHDELRLVKDSDGQIKDIIGNWIDISKSKKLEQEKHEHDQSIQQAQKMQALGTLAGGIAHEFNNMLAIIGGYADLLSTLDDLNGKGKSYIDEIITAVHRSGALVKQILAFSHKNVKTPQLINLHDQLDKDMEFLKNAIPSSVTIEISNERINKKILVDPVEIRQILINLISNAAHAMNNKGLITLSFNEVNHDCSKITDGLILQDGNYLKLSVTDSGTGISEEVQQKIFEPFYTTKDVGEGTGLGLAIVYSMVESYGGAIRIKSKVGKYTTFELYFPIADQNIHLSPALEKANLVKTDLQLKILFVDDEIALCNLVRNMFESIVAKVTIFTNGHEALQHFQLNPDLYDVLITDQMMPDMLGTELSKAVLEINKDMKIILCTGYSVDLNRENLLSKGIKGFIEKPFMQEDLILELDKLTKN